jgi:hypothetical protein
MASFACLRVLLPAAVAERPELAGLVNKFAGAFLESRWAWPRRFEALGPGVYLLIEPRGGQLDHLQMREMASDLQLKLFGTGGEGEVALVTFEGDAPEVARFAALQDLDLANILAGLNHTPPFEGRLARITADGVAPIALPKIAQSQAANRAPRAPPRPAKVGQPIFYGVYFTPKEFFVGSAVGLQDARYNLMDGSRPLTAEAAQDFDENTIAALGRALDEWPSVKGLFFAPICYASLIHRVVRETYATVLETLPQARREQLAVAVYDAPRELSYASAPKVREFLRAYFDYVDLQTNDPAFAVERLPEGLANSVTLVLPDADAATRLAAIRRFSANRTAYKSRRIWAAVTNVRTQGELEMCFANGVPFVSGRAVSAAMERAPGNRAVPASALPLRDTGRDPDNQPLWA